MFNVSIANNYYNVKDFMRFMPEGFTESDGVEAVEFLEEYADIDGYTFHCIVDNLGYGGTCCFKTLEELGEYDEDEGVYTDEDEARYCPIAGPDKGFLNGVYVLVEEC